jgi:hypothetical protein
MGQILTHPLTSKLYQRHGNELMRVGVAEMQGYRVNMEVNLCLMHSCLCTVHHLLSSGVWRGAGSAHSEAVTQQKAPKAVVL